MPTNPSVIVTLIVQIILALVLIVVVLFQSGSEEGLSGTIAGGANNFFGKNKGKTAEAKLKKLTAWVAVLFLISSVLLGYFVRQSMPQPVIPANIPVNVEQPVDIEAAPADADVEVVPADAETTPDAPATTGDGQN